MPDDPADPVNPETDLAETALPPGRCTEQVGVLWVDCTNDHGTVIERRAIPLTCTVVNPLPALPFDHTHVYWDPIGGLAVTRQADPQRDVDPKGCIRDTPAPALPPGVGCEHCPEPATTTVLDGVLRSDGRRIARVCADCAATWAFYPDPPSEEGPAVNLSRPIRVDARDLLPGDRLFVDCMANDPLPDDPTPPSEVLTTTAPQSRGFVRLRLDGIDDLYEFGIDLYRDHLGNESWSCPVWAQIQVNDRIADAVNQASARRK